MSTRRKKALKALPLFDSEDQEREFWSTHDSTEYLDWSQAEPVVFSSLKPSTSTISLRLPDAILEALKLLANVRDVPYQSLLKVFLAERIRHEFDKLATRGGSLAVPPNPRMQPTGRTGAKPRSGAKARSAAKEQKIVRARS